MGLAVEQRRLDVDQREAVLGPLLAPLAEALLDRRNVFLRHGAAEDLVFKVDVVGVGLFSLLLKLGTEVLDPLLAQRLIQHLDDGVLAAAARLLDVARLQLESLGQGLAVSHHGLAGQHRDAMVALELVNRHLKVQLAHARQDQLLGFRIGAGPQRRIVAHHLAQRFGQLRLLNVLGRRDRLRDHGLGEADFLQQDRLVLRAERMSRVRLLQTHHGHDVAGLGHFQRRSPNSR